ncbi:hypothetical protein [Massilia sp. erpn]|uniref:hypothetical protein n=1 Tax=Massilia sp. erpn TaxID=2738142 RepID=UPI0021034967|nr:hypothetical protein [Massilia sp. erpn]UTY55883.1 hypothetical protein HPQ68_00980 [Massilia sp. erpn]
MNEKKILTVAVKETGDQAAAKVIWIQYPLLEQIATSFAGYVGMESIDASGKPLLVTAIRKALAEFRQREDDEDAARAAFVNALLEYSCDVFAQDIVVETPQGEIEWSQFAGGLMAFLAQLPHAIPTVTRKECLIAPMLARTFMMTKIIPSSVLDQRSLSELFNGAEMLA